VSGPWPTGGADPVAIAVESAAVRAVVAFSLVVVVGVAVRRVRPGLLDRAVAAALERPGRTPIYGTAAAVVGWLGGVYLVGQVSRLGGSGLGSVVAVVVVAGTLGTAGFGVAVVGTALATVVGAPRQPTGLVVGAGVGALVWLALPAWPALIVWALVAATGLGGPARRWLHASRSVEK
jgi:hypothetical protein